MEPLAPLERSDLDALVDAVDRRALRVRHVERREAVHRRREAVEVARIGRRHHHVRHGGDARMRGRQRIARSARTGRCRSADSGDGSLDSTTSTVTSGSRMRRRTRRTVPATVSPSAIRRLSVADACDGSTLAAVPPDCIVAATVVRTRAAGSPPSAANTRAVSGGSGAEQPQQMPRGPGRLRGELRQHP